MNTRFIELNNMKIMFDYFMSKPLKNNQTAVIDWSYYNYDKKHIAEIYNVWMFEYNELNNTFDCYYENQYTNTGDTYKHLEVKRELVVEGLTIDDIYEFIKDTSEEEDITVYVDIFAKENK